ncbi:uncharacterized protein KGF55_003739 [Candida pseudojiufengensis]|uniref:uncharacterized protein n=1 Tax=Candida pseudojiufengensis TaxID=497109 RepID=UPI0022253765|nr:uncharacterized protein KGF55_003739 [Candida pseudojiufengensis]KAI5962663.1 hypothetical protein KGF55_003739 [Candida pseudojiufengensis]
MIGLIFTNHVYTHSNLWSLYLTILIPQLIIFLAIYSLFFLTFYPVQSVLYTSFMGPFGIFIAWYSLYSQSSNISQFIVTIVLIPYIQKIVFDAILSKECKNENFLKFISMNRSAKSLTRGENILRLYMRKIQRYVYEVKYFSILPFSITKILILFFVNFIPVVGPFFVLIVKVNSKSIQVHRRYFILKGFDVIEIENFYRLNKNSYLTFAIFALLLEMIPCVNVLLLFTNTIGAALWAVDLENLEIKNAKPIEITAENTNADENVDQMQAHSNELKQRPGSIFEEFD